MINTLQQLPLTIQTDHQTQISYTDSGTGPTMLFIHGLGSNGKAFMLNSSELSQYYRCITVDLPGYGASSKENDRISMTYFAGQLLLFLQHLKLGEVILIGHSMGAQIALHMVHLHPTLATDLVLIAPAGFETFNAMERQWIESMTRPGILKSASYEQIMSAFAANFYVFPGEAQFMVEDRLRLMESKADYDFYCSLIYHATTAMLDEPIFHMLGSVQQNALIIFGNEDQLIPNQILHPGATTKSVAEKGTAQLPLSHLLMVSRAGHFVMFERPRIVNDAIHSFLRGNRIDV
ncbi:MAG: alpha/beta hydrolase [Saprospiraceae bacterium]|nr:alpha/beta hydrolase [Saprospiraceae bacterium]